ncbi:MAG: tetratricopeptide repeat protein [Planctomycetota bacterium]
MKKPWEWLTRSDTVRGASVWSRSIWRRYKLFKWVLIALPLLAVLMLLSPVIHLITPLLNLVVGVINSLLKTTAGRFALVLVLGILVTLFFFRKIKAAGARLFGYYALRSFLSGMDQMAMGRYRAAIRQFRKVARISRTVDLEQAVPVYPTVAPEAKIKLGLCYQAIGDQNRGMQWLERVPKKDLPPALRRLLNEGRALLYDDNPELMDETVRRELGGALEEDPRNLRLLETLRERVTRDGDPAALVSVQERIVKVLRGEARTKAKRDLGVMYYRWGKQLFVDGRIEDARQHLKKAASLVGDFALPTVLLGDIEIQSHSLKEGVKLWAKMPSLPVLERIQLMLRNQDELDDARLAQTLAEFPYVGTLVLLAQELIERNDIRRAERTLSKLEEMGYEHHHLTRLRAELALRAERPKDADRLYLKALEQFIDSSKG